TLAIYFADFSEKFHQKPRLFIELLIQNGRSISGFWCSPNSIFHVILKVFVVFFMKFFVFFAQNNSRVEKFS
ncbi:MAG: hypothetical protein ACRDFB_08570, partial [Rhabdochlamydiaceae bacterium]